MDNFDYMLEQDPEALFHEMANEYAPKAREYFGVLRLAILRIDGVYIESTFEIAQHKISDKVWALACKIMRILYEDKRGNKCPKCGQYYTNAPAISREDNKTEICPSCGTREAMEAFMKEKGDEADA